MDKLLQAVVFVHSCTHTGRCISENMFKIFSLEQMDMDSFHKSQKILIDQLRTYEVAKYDRIMKSAQYNRYAIFLENLKVFGTVFLKYLQENRFTSRSTRTTENYSPVS